MERRQQILNIINKTDKPISASTLAGKFGVSRQIVVGDIALLRAEGHTIIATPRGYIIENKEGLKETIAVKHLQSDMEDELNTIVDLGGEIIDVIVEHSVYGEIKGNLHLSSRYDVSVFIEKVKTSKAKPLSTLTDGIHLHTILVKDEQMLERIKEALDLKGYLYH